MHALPKRTQNRVQRATEYIQADISRYTQGNDSNFTLRFDFIACAPPYYIKHIHNAWIQ